VCVCVSPQVDEVDEFGGELPLLGAAELRRVALHHLRQLIEHTVPLRVGEPSCGQFVLKHTHTITALQQTFNITHHMTDHTSFSPV